MKKQVKMEIKTTDCVICGEGIVYQRNAVQRVCFCCKKSFMANAVCTNNHFVCDNCHSLSAEAFITEYCLNSDSTNPARLAQEMMRHLSVKMHGPEHHFLIPAALLTSYYNMTENRAELALKLVEAKKRAKNVLGGFCGFYGSCGAAVGVGIFTSIATGSTPLSKSEWRLANLATSEALREIAMSGGPRCCKRNTFTAITAAARFVKAHMDICLESTVDIKCTHSHRNKECIKIECKYYSQ